MTVKQSIDALLASGGKRWEVGSNSAVAREYAQSRGRVQISEVFVERLANDQAEVGAWFFNEWLQVPGCLGYGDVIPTPKPEVVAVGIENMQKVLDLHKAGMSNKKLVLNQHLRDTQVKFGMKLITTTLDNDGTVQSSMVIMTIHY